MNDMGTAPLTALIMGIINSLLRSFEFLRKIRKDVLERAPNIGLSFNGGWIGVQKGKLYENPVIRLTNSGNGRAKDVRIHLEGIKILHVASLDADKDRSSEFTVNYESQESKDKAKALFESKKNKLLLQVECEDVCGKHYTFDDWLVLNRFDQDSIYILEKETK